MSSGWKTRRTRDMNRKALKEMLTQCQFAGPEYQKIFKDKSIAIRPLIRFFKHMVPRRPGYTEQNNFITKYVLISIEMNGRHRTFVLTRSFFVFSGQSYSFAFLIQLSMVSIHTPFCIILTIMASSRGRLKKFNVI